MESRQVPGMYLADVSFKGPRHFQDVLLQYRRGMFMNDCLCTCGERFKRGHETCLRLRHPYQLSKSEKQHKADMLKQLDSKDSKLTDVDYLLNTGQLDKAIRILSSVKSQLGKVYHEAELAVTAKQSDR